MTLKELELFSPFRGLQTGFKIVFSRPIQPINKVEPLCFTGLNGSGKSNVMQLLAEIFYYLETYVLAEAQQYVEKETEFGFKIHYQFPIYNDSVVITGDPSDWYLKQRGVIITKQPGELPVFEYYYDDEDEKKTLAVTVDCAKLLPNFVIGYSSGMNELISNPFIKMDFFYQETMKRKMQKKQEQEEKLQRGEEIVETPEAITTPQEAGVNRLFFLDYQSNAFAMISNFLMKENKPSPGGNAKTELDVINDIVNIDDLVSFRIRLNLQIKTNYAAAEIKERLWDYVSLGKERARDEGFTYQSFTPFSFFAFVELPPALTSVVQRLVDCSTTMNEIKLAEASDNRTISFELYFQVDDEMKKAFRDKFRGGAMGLFQNLYFLNLMNIETYSQEIREQVKRADPSINIADLLPKLPTEEKVFHVDNIRLKKKTGKTLYYKQLSDGEHQYLQVAGSLMLLDDQATLFLMDEPETHFNPEWRSKLISTLNEILEIKITGDRDKIVLRQEIIFTTHSPFIVSDCQPTQVYIFERNPSTQNVGFRQPDFNTYGTSVNFLTAKVFNKKETIAGLVDEQLKQLQKAVKSTVKTKEQAIEEVNKLGDSVEKIIFLDEISRV